MSKESPTLISLFAGAGGLDIGLEMAGFCTLVANELEQHICETLRQNKILNALPKKGFEDWLSLQMQQRCHSRTTPNFINALRNRLKDHVGTRTFLSEANVIEGDIRTISSDKILRAASKKPREITLVAGGPPCQPFSRAGKRETIETSDGQLFLEFVRVVKDCQPRWFLFENVKGIAQSKTLVPYEVCNSCGQKNVVSFSERDAAIKGEYVSLFCKECASKDTCINVANISGGSLEIILHEFESIGYKCYYKLLNAADFGVPQSRERLFIVGSRDNEKFDWPKQTHFNPLLSSKSRKAGAQLSLLLNETGLKPWRTVKDILWQNSHDDFGLLDYSKAQIWVKNVVRPHDEPVTWSLNRPCPTVGAHQAAKLAIAPQGVPATQLARQQWHTKGCRQKDLPPVFVEHSMLSDAELLELQTFPRSWYLYGTRMERAFQIGNAVPPALAMAVGKSILDACKANASVKINETAAA